MIILHQFQGMVFGSQKLGFPLFPSKIQGVIHSQSQTPLLILSLVISRLEAMARLILNCNEMLHI